MSMNLNVESSSRVVPLSTDVRSKGRRQEFDLLVYPVPRVIPAFCLSSCKNSALIDVDAVSGVVILTLREMF